MADAVVVEKKEEPKTITNESVLAKVKAGQELTADEKEFIKGDPNLDQFPGAEPEEEAAEESTEKKEEPQKKSPEEATAPPPQKSAEKPPVSSDGKVSEERLALLEAEIQKPESQQDPTKFSNNEIGLYIELKKQRHRNKKIVEENEILKVEQVVDRLKKKEAPQEESDPLDEIGEDQIITGKELKALLKSRREKPEPAKEEKAASKPIITPEQVGEHEKSAKTILAAKGINDYDEVAQYAFHALADDLEAQGLLAETAKAGGNTALLAYSLIKASKKWPGIEKAIQADRASVSKPEEKVTKEPDQDVQSRARRIIANETKVRTTGAASGGGESGEITEADVRAMTTEDVRRLPKETREKILKKFGSTPNYSV